MDSGPSRRRFSRRSSRSSAQSNLNAVNLLEEEEEDEETKRRRQFENNIKLPLLVFCLTFLFPPLGFIFFVMNRNLSRTSRRYRWFTRALGLGSALSVVYMLVICCILHHTTLYKMKGDEIGYGYE